VRREARLTLGFVVSSKKDQITELAICPDAITYAIGYVVDITDEFVLPLVVADIVSTKVLTNGTF
jgi:hypothetical protein